MEKDSPLCIPNLRSPKPTLHAPGGSIPWVEATRTWASMSDTSIAKCQKFRIPKGSKCTNRGLLGYIYLRMYEITSVYTYMPQHSGLVTLSTKSSEATAAGASTILVTPKSGQESHGYEGLSTMLPCKSCIQLDRKSYHQVRNPVLFRLLHHTP